MFSIHLPFVCGDLNISTSGDITLTCSCILITKGGQGAILLCSVLFFS